MKYGISVKIEPIGNARVGKHFENAHEAKSKAGKLFHNEAVKSVCVFDETGTARLYLKRLENGKYHREER